MLIDRDRVIELREEKLIDNLKNKEGIEDPWKLRKKFRSDFDQIEEHADDYLVQELQCVLSRGKKVIIDSQLPLLSFAALHVLAYSPLEILIERDKQRSQRLNRPDQRNYYARAFLFETFAQLYDLEKATRGESELDTLRMQSFKGEISPFLKVRVIREFFEPHWLDEHPLYLYPKEAPDLIIKTHLQTVEESVQIILTSSPFKKLY